MTADASAHAPYIRILNTFFKLVGSQEDGYYRGILTNGKHEENTDIVYLFAVAPDAVVFDIGANIGCTSLLMSLLCNKGMVYSFEPSDMAFRFLQKNITNNGIKNIIAHNIAFSDREGALNFCQSATFTAGSFSVPDGATEDHFKSKKTPCLTLDKFCDDNKIKSVDFVKIDVEGAELDVLRGGENFFRHYKPRCLIEFNSWTLINYRQILPKNLLDYIFSVFDHVCSVDRETGFLTPLLSESDKLHFLSHNLYYGFVDNLYCFFNDQSSMVVESYIESLMKRRGKKVDSYKPGELEAVYNSFSWKITEPLRKVKSFLARKMK